MGVHGVCERCGWGRFVCPAYLRVSANDVDGGIWCLRTMWVGSFCLSRVSECVCERCRWGYMVSAMDVGGGIWCLRTMWMGVYGVCERCNYVCARWCDVCARWSL